MRTHPWRHFFTLLALIAFPAAGKAADFLAADQAQREGDVLWFDLKKFDIEGQGWQETKAPYDRLPGKAEGVVRDAVWGLSRHSAGLCVRFVSDAPAIRAKWTLTSERLAMDHMPATGVSGVDLYVKTETGGWHWLAIGRPAAQTNSVQLVSDIPPGVREYLLYLPLYNGVSSVTLGIPASAHIGKAGPYKVKPILFYGTSITQGGCASRPGMVHTAILGRKLQHPVINLGFSGNGKMEPEMAALFAELDPAVYVLDCLPNMTAEEVTARVEPFVAKLREAHPTTPILLVEDRSYTNAFLIAAQRNRNATSRAALKKAYERLTAAGVPHLSYLDGDLLLGSDGEDTVDSSHPTDLGFLRQADAMEKVLGPLLTGAPN